MSKKARAISALLLAMDARSACACLVVARERALVDFVETRVLDVMAWVLSVRRSLA